VTWGGFSPLPIRLGGSSLEGWPPENHARFCADLVAIKRTLPIAVWTFTKSGGTVTIHSFYGMNGIVVATDAPAPGAASPGVSNFAWIPPILTDPYGVVYSVRARHGRATVHGSSARFAVVDTETISTLITVRTFDESANLVDAKATVRIW
jgi:hypothetical protein